MEDIMIVGGGIGGLTLALFLHKAGVNCQIYESSNVIKPLGMGVNLLPYATEKLAQIDILDELCEVAIETQESVFCNRFGQIIFRRPAGKLAGDFYPQLSIHRGELHDILFSKVKERIGIERVHLGWKCASVIQHDNHAVAQFVDSEGNQHPPQLGKLVIGCDGVHSKIRQIFYPAECASLYHGINMWRGVSQSKPFLSGASMLRIGLPKIGKLVVYPIKNNINENGDQLINWVVEIESEKQIIRDCRIDDFIHYFSDWKFPWLDIPEMLNSHQGQILQYPMVDKDPVNAWSFGRVTLLGDAAHPMVPLGSNGAGQAILDSATLQSCIIKYGASVLALKKYEECRLPQTSKITYIDRNMTQDRLLNEVFLRTNDSPFLHSEDIFVKDELIKLSEPTYNINSNGN